MSLRSYENTQCEGRGNFLFTRKHAYSRMRAAQQRCSIHHMVSKVLMSRRESVSRLSGLQRSDASDFFD
jgi:hypothetical protein